MSMLRGVRRYSYKPKPAVPVTAAAPAAARERVDVAADRYHACIARLGSAARLTDAVAIQCFTHKSWHHGKDGFNEKLAFFGRRILESRVSGYLISRPTSADDACHGRDVSALAHDRIGQVTHASRIGTWALRQADVGALLRWKPRDAADVQGSGQSKVAADAVLALIAAVELQAGAAAAAALVDQTIIPGLSVFEDTTTTTPTNRTT